MLSNGICVLSGQQYGYTQKERWEIGTLSMIFWEAIGFLESLYWSLMKKVNLDCALEMESLA